MYYSWATVSAGLLQEYRAAYRTLSFYNGFLLSTLYLLALCSLAFDALQVNVLHCPWNTSVRFRAIPDSESCFSLLQCAATRHTSSRATPKLSFFPRIQRRWGLLCTSINQFLSLPDTAQHGGFRAPSWLPSFEELRMGGLSGNGNGSWLI